MKSRHLILTALAAFATVNCGDAFDDPARHACTRCSGDLQCGLGGICENVEGANRCLAPCDAGTCGEGFSCQSTRDGERMSCVPDFGMCTAAPEPCPDADGDGTCDADEPCQPGTSDPACQEDPECPDSDGDGVCNADDRCPNHSPDDPDGDGACGTASACPDSDSDGVCNADDPCPSDSPDDPDGDGLCGSSTEGAYDLRGVDRQRMTANSMLLIDTMEIDQDFAMVEMGFYMQLESPGSCTLDYYVLSGGMRGGYTILWSSTQTISAGGALDYHGTTVGQVIEKATSGDTLISIAVGWQGCDIAYEYNHSGMRDVDMGAGQMLAGARGHGYTGAASADEEYLDVGSSARITVRTRQ